MQEIIIPFFEMMNAIPYVSFILFGIILIGFPLFFLKILFSANSYKLVSMIFLLACFYIYATHTTLPAGTCYIRSYPALEKLFWYMSNAEYQSFHDGLAEKENNLILLEKMGATNKDDLIRQIEEQKKAMIEVESYHRNPKSFMRPKEYLVLETRGDFNTVINEDSEILSKQQIKVDGSEFKSSTCSPRMEAKYLEYKKKMLNE